MRSAGVPQLTPEEEYSLDYAAIKLVLEARREDLESQGLRLAGKREDLWLNPWNLRNRYYQYFNRGADEKIKKLEVFIQMLEGFTGTGRRGEGLASLPKPRLLIQTAVPSTPSLSSHSSVQQDMAGLDKIIDQFEAVMKLSSWELSIQRYGWWHTAGGTLGPTGVGALIGFWIGGPLGSGIGAGIGAGVGFLLSFTRPVQKLLPWGNSTRGEDSIGNPTRGFDDLLKEKRKPITERMQRLQAICSNALPGYVRKASPEMYVEMTEADKRKKAESCMGRLTSSSVSEGKYDRPTPAVVSAADEATRLLSPDSKSGDRVFLMSSDTSSSFEFPGREQLLKRSLICGRATPKSPDVIRISSQSDYMDFVSPKIK